MKSFPKDAIGRVLIEALRRSKDKTTVELAEIASIAKVTLSTAREVLSRIEGLPSGELLPFGPRLRLHLAMEIARIGQLKGAAEVLSWQEFEKFTEQCLEEAGFRTQRNVRIKGEGRMWQIDVVGFRGELVLAIDCKHWNTPSYLSRFKFPADHQRHATLHLLETLKQKTTEEGNRRQALAVILTLREPPAQLSEDAVLVSVEKLPSFLGGVAPYDEDLPFITPSSSIVENPMSRPT